METHFKIQIEIIFCLFIPCFPYVGQIIKGYCIFKSSGECCASCKGIVEYVIKTIACFAMLVQLIDHSCQ